MASAKAHGALPAPVNPDATSASAQCCATTASSAHATLRRFAFAAAASASTRLPTPVFGARAVLGCAPSEQQQQQQQQQTLLVITPVSNDAHGKQKEKEEQLQDKHNQETKHQCPLETTQTSNQHLQSKPVATASAQPSATPLFIFGRAAAAASTSASTSASASATTESGSNTASVNAWLLSSARAEELATANSTFASAAPSRRRPVRDSLLFGPRAPRRPLMHHHQGVSSRGSTGSEQPRTVPKRMREPASVDEVVGMFSGLRATCNATEENDNGNLSACANANGRDDHAELLLAEGLRTLEVKKRRRKLITTEIEQRDNESEKDKDQDDENDVVREQDDNELSFLVERCDIQESSNQSSLFMPYIV